MEKSQSTKEEFKLYKARTTPEERLSRNLPKRNLNCFNSSFKQPHNSGRNLPKRNLNYRTRASIDFCGKSQSTKEEFKLRKILKSWRCLRSRNLPKRNLNWFKWISNTFAFFRSQSTKEEFKPLYIPCFRRLSERSQSTKEEFKLT